MKLAFDFYHAIAYKL